MLYDLVVNMKKATFVKGWPCQLQLVNKSGCLGSHRTLNNLGNMVSFGCYFLKAILLSQVPVCWEYQARVTTPRKIRIFNASQHSKIEWKLFCGTETLLWQICQADLPSWNHSAYAAVTKCRRHGGWMKASEWGASRAGFPKAHLLGWQMGTTMLPLCLHMASALFIDTPRVLPLF